MKCQGNLIAGKLEKLYLEMDMAFPFWGGVYGKAAKEWYGYWFGGESKVALNLQFEVLQM